MIIGFSGHRPDKCEPEAVVRQLVRNNLNPTWDAVVAGMATGFDLWAADEAQRAGIKVICAIPWRGHQETTSDPELYEKVLNESLKAHYMSESKKYPGPHIYHERNRWIVDHSDKMMTYMHPDAKRGGTYACVQYAIVHGKKIRNIRVTR